MVADPMDKDEKGYAQKPNTIPTAATDGGAAAAQVSPTPTATPNIAQQQKTKPEVNSLNKLIDSIQLRQEKQELKQQELQHDIQQATSATTRLADSFAQHQVTTENLRLSVLQVTTDMTDM